MTTDLVFVFGQSFLIGFSGAMMPGPMFTATVSEGLKRGAWAGPRVVLGHGVIELALLLALVAGIGPFLEQARLWIALVGGATLVIMGLLMMRGAKSAAETVHDMEGDPGILRSPEMAGILTSASNPYFYLWWASVGLGLTTDSLQFGILGAACFYVGHILSDFAWFGFVGVLSARGRSFPSGILYRILVACGLGLVVLGMLFILRYQDL